MAELFYYTARTADGARIRGSVEAAGEAIALASLRTRSLVVTSLDEAGTARGTLLALSHIGPVGRKHLVAFFRSFAALIGAGIPMRSSLVVAAEQCSDVRLREALNSIANGVEAGLPLSDAMARHPREFSTLYVVMIRAGELGGVLDEVLERLAGVLEREQMLRKRIVASLAYPASVACSAIALMLFLLASIVPSFRSLYEQMHVPLPAVTRMLLAAGLVLHSRTLWIAMAATAAALCASLPRIRRAPGASQLFESALFGLPLIGAIARKSTVARFARTFGTLLRCGVGMLAALQVGGDALSSVAYREAVETVRTALAEGECLWKPLERTALFEPMFVHMVRVGEETGALDAMLVKLAEYYEIDVETALSTLGALIEPALIVLVGGAVGFIVSAIFIPLYTLIGNIK